MSPSILSSPFPPTYLYTLWTEQQRVQRSYIVKTTILLACEHEAHMAPIEVNPSRLKDISVISHALKAQRQYRIGIGNTIPVTRWCAKIRIPRISRNLQVTFISCKCIFSEPPLQTTPAIDSTVPSPSVRKYKRESNKPFLPNNLIGVIAKINNLKNIEFLKMMCVYYPLKD